MDNLESPYQAQPSKLSPAVTPPPQPSPVRLPANDFEHVAQGGSLETAPSVQPPQDFASIASGTPNPMPNAPMGAPEQVSEGLPSGIRIQSSFAQGAESRKDLLSQFFGPDNVRLVQGKDNKQDLEWRRSPVDGWKSTNQAAFSLEDYIGDIAQALGAGATEAVAGAGLTALGIPQAGFASLPAAGAGGVALKRALYKYIYGKDLPGSSGSEMNQAAASSLLIPLVGTAVFKGLDLIEEGAGKLSRLGTDELSKTATMQKVEFLKFLQNVQQPEKAAIQSIADFELQGPAQVGEKLGGNRALPTTTSGPSAPLLYQIKEDYGKKIGVYSDMLKGQQFKVDPMLDSMLEIGAKPQYFGRGPKEWTPFEQAADGTKTYNKLPLTASALKDMRNQGALGSLDGSVNEYKRYATIWNALVEMKQGTQRVGAEVPSELSFEAMNAIMKDPAQANAISQQLHEDYQGGNPYTGGGITSNTMKNYISMAGELADFDRLSGNRGKADAMFGEIYNTWAKYRDNSFMQALDHIDQSGISSNSYAKAMQTYSSDIGVLNKFIRANEQSASADVFAKQIISPENHDQAQKFMTILRQYAPDVHNELKGAVLSDMIGKATDPETGTINGSALMQSLKSLGDNKSLLVNPDEEAKLAALSRQANVLQKKISKSEALANASVLDAAKLMFGISRGTPYGAAIAANRLPKLIGMYGENVQAIDAMKGDAFLEAAKQVDNPNAKSAYLYARDLVKMLYTGAKAVNNRYVPTEMAKTNVYNQMAKAAVAQGISQGGLSLFQKSSVPTRAAGIWTQAMQSLGANKDAVNSAFDNANRDLSTNQ